ncbi:MAG: GAF domain-containing protein, partial [Pseudomonadota bacterium]|nr:GAF domain-containing protein [Pseudomonadota bacterium]
MPSTFIKAAELWLPGDDGSLLEFRGGAFGPAKRFAALSRSMCFGRGEGLPGRAWDEGQPVLLRDFASSGFQRGDAARAAGFTCAIALPYFAHGEITAVLVLFCGHDPVQASALELWHHNARVTTDMTLADGAYGSAEQSFEAISRDTYLPRGIGLPGLAWQRGASVFLEDLASVPGRFLRSETAAAAGLLRGLAVPVGSRVDDCHVVTFLAGARLPLALRIERWVCDSTKTKLLRDLAFSELHGGRSAAVAELPISAGS